MYYYRESTKDNYEDDIKNLNKKLILFIHH